MSTHPDGVQWHSSGTAQGSGVTFMCKQVKSFRQLWGHKDRSFSEWTWVLQAQPIWPERSSARGPRTRSRLWRWSLRRITRPCSSTSNVLVGLTVVSSPVGPQINHTQHDFVCCATSSKMFQCLQLPHWSCSCSVCLIWLFLQHCYTCNNNFWDNLLPSKMSYRIVHV